MATRFRTLSHLSLELLEDRQLLNGMPLVDGPPPVPGPEETAHFRTGYFSTEPDRLSDQGRPMSLFSGWDRGDYHAAMFPPTSAWMQNPEVQAFRPDYSHGLARPEGLIYLDRTYLPDFFPRNNGRLEIVVIYEVDAVPSLDAPGHLGEEILSQGMISLQLPSEGALLTGTLPLPGPSAYGSPLLDLSVVKSGRDHPVRSDNPGGGLDYGPVSAATANLPADPTLLNRSVRPQVQAPTDAAIVINPAQGTLAAQVAAVTGRLEMEKTGWTGLAFLSGAAVAGSSAFLPGRDDSITLPGPASHPGLALVIPAQTARPGEAAVPQAQAKLTGEPLPPEGADLLTQGMSFGLAALDRAVRSLLEPDAGSFGRGQALLRWLGLSTGMVGAALAYIVVRERRTRPSVALPGAGSLGGAPLDEEDLS